MNMKIITLIALALGCLAVVGIANTSDDSDAAVVDPSTGTQVGDLYYTFSGDEATVVGISSSISSATSITIPDTVTSGGTTYNVTAIADDPNGVFKGMTALQTVTFSANLTSIGTYAFQNCTNLDITSLPDGVTTIKTYAFSGCTSLALTSLPDGVTTISSGAFSRCTNLALTSLPDGVTNIPSDAFYRCTNLALTSLPDGVTNIGDTAFSGCTNLALTSLPDGVTSIGGNAFQNCTNLALTSLPDGLTTIRTYAFSGCTSLALTSLPSGLTSIGTYAFQNCTNLETLSIPLATTSIGTNLFNGCTNLVLSLDISVTAGGETFTDQWVTGLSSGGAPTYVVTAPSTSGNYMIDGWTYESTDYANGDSITMTANNRSITGNAIGVDFGACGDNLTASMLFADYILTITGTGAMYDYTAGSPALWDSYKASIVSLSLPEGMTTYGDYAFYGCTGLSGVLTIPSAITHVGDSAFYDCGYSGMIIEGSPTLTDVSDPTFGSSDDHSFLEVLNLGDTAIEAGQYGLPDDAVVSDCIPLLGYVAPTSITETVQKEGAAYDLMKIIPVIIILAVLVMAATAVIKRD